MGTPDLQHRPGHLASTAGEFPQNSREALSRSAKGIGGFPAVCDAICDHELLRATCYEGVRFRGEFASHS